jgi:steroid 5-alpha reductase family enzyme
MDGSRASHKSLTIAFVLCAKAYLIALCIAILVGYATGEHHPILIAFVADVAATLVIYTFARYFKNASFYDAYWSLAPIAIAVYFLLSAAACGTCYCRQMIVISLVTVWGLRLTYNWARGWRGLGHEDWRYAAMRAKHGRRFWLVELIGIEMMPTIVVFLGCLSLYPAIAFGENWCGGGGELFVWLPYTGANPWGVLDCAAAAITAAAILIETIADEQLRRFARTAQPGQIMNKGLWRYSRHPNYLGEVAFWWGLYLFALAAKPSYWWAVAGPIAITILFVFVSVPMMDKRNLERRPGYAERMKRVSPLIPWFPRKS